MIRLLSITTFALGLLAGPAFAQVDILLNGSMESGEGAGAIDEQIADKWTEFGINVERSGAYSFLPSSGHALKAFGDGDSNAVGASQEILNVSAGQSVTASVKLFSPANDKLGGSGQAGMQFAFLNQFGGVITLHQVYVLDANSPANTWLTASLGPLTAPAGTNKVRLTCRLQWTPGDVSGAAYWDDAQVRVNGGANRVENGDFETAGRGPGQSPNGIDDWTGFNDQEKSGLFSRTGLYSLQLGTREAYSGLFQNMGVLNSGEHIVLTAYAWVPSSDVPNGNWRAGIKLEFDPNANVPPPEENLPFDENTPNNTWTLVELNTIVPNGATIARIVCIYLADGGTTGSVHFDSAFAERGSAPGVNQLVNGSFESGPGGGNGIANWMEFNSGGSQCQKNCFELASYHHGICSARGAGTAVAGIYQEITVTPGESLSTRAYLLTPDFEDLTGGSARAGLKIEWAVGGVPPDIDIGPPGNGNTIGTGAPTNTWIPLTIDFTMPTGSSAIARFTNLIEKGTALTGHVYIDDCSAVVLNRCDPCDTNCDGSVNGFDIQPFVDILSGSGSQCSDCSADTNSDGSINGFDIQGFVECLSG